MRRPLTWVILAWNALMAVWLVTGLVSASRDANSSCVGEFAESCRSGAAIGLGIGVFFVLGVAAFGDVILLVIWLVTRRPAQAQVAPRQRPSGASPDWYPDPAGLFWRRYWDGRRWTAFVSSRSGEESLDPAGTPPTLVTTKRTSK